jgi:hypothetical protein
MAKKRITNSQRKPIDTAAGLARRLKVHKGTVTRALRRVKGGVQSRIGHQFALSGGLQSRIAKAIKRAGK